MFKSDFAKEIFNKKYAGDFADNPQGFYESMAKRISLGDGRLEQDFLNFLTDQRFSPGGRILAFTGRPHSSVSLMNCTTHQVDADSLKAISTTMDTVMQASSHGQGIGIDLSKLRPKGAEVNNAARSSTGAISFMELLNAVGFTIGQEGRRAALLFSMSVQHPDLWRKDAQDVTCPKCDGKGCFNCRGKGLIPYDFLHIKSIPGHVESANISVMVTDDFMRAVEADQPWRMHYEGESGGQPFSVERTVPAKVLFYELAKCAYQAAEPGVLFVDTIHKSSNSDRLGSDWVVVGCNACSEMMLDQDGVCNLGSLNLSKYVHLPFTASAYFDFPRFIQDTCLGVEFLDNVNTIELGESRSISKRQEESIRHLRRVGLGVMGLADTLVMMGLRYTYGTTTINFIRAIFETLRNTAYRHSAFLAEWKGPCEAWAILDEAQRREVLSDGFYATLPEGIRERIVANGLRNTTIISIAPTGSISNLCGTSSGIEPLFAREYVRRVRLNSQDEFITYVHPAVQQSRALGLPDGIWDTAYEVDPETHVRIQALIQSLVDSSIAKTTNMPATATLQDVADVYMLAWKLGLKGITVYVDGSRQEQVLYQTEAGVQELCPECGSPVIKHGGCTECPNCGWGKCA